MTRTIDFETLHQQVIAIVKKAGLFIKEQNINFDSHVIEVKSLNQLVSYVDKEAEMILVKGLSILMPESGFITEEETVEKSQAEYIWIIDPLDGTTNFAHKLPVFSVSVALQRNGQSVLGFVYDICNDEMFSAYEGGSAYLNGKPIRVSSVPSLDKSLLATGFPYYDFKQMPEYLETLKHFMKHTHGLRRMGSAAIDLAYTACGRFDGFFEYGLQPWDVAGGTFILKQAGGVVSDFEGGNDYIFGKTIVGSNAHLYQEFLEVLQSYFKPQ
jgi:myo-inositol-1(or 4)-monophosphatase